MASDLEALILIPALGCKPPQYMLKGPGQHHVRGNLLVANLDSCWLLPEPKHSLHKCYEQNQQQRAAPPAKLLAKGLGPHSCGAPTGYHEGHG